MFPSDSLNICIKKRKSSITFVKKNDFLIVKSMEQRDKLNDATMESRSDFVIPEISAPFVMEKLPILNKTSPFGTRIAQKITKNHKNT